MTTTSRTSGDDVILRRWSVIFLQLGLAALVACGSPRPRGTTNAPESTLDRIRSEHVLNVGYVVYPPTVIKDPNTGELSGQFVDASRYLAQAMAVRIRFHEADWSTFIAGLQNGQYDLSIAATYRTIPRAMAVAFTKPIIYIGQGAIARRGDNRWKSVDDLNRPNITIAVAQGERSEEFARLNLPKARLRTLSTSNLVLPLSEVVAGRADVGMADVFTVDKFVKKQPTVMPLFGGRPIEVIGVGWAVRPNDVLWLNFLNTSLDFMESAGLMAKWEQKYGARWFHPYGNSLAE